MNRRGLFKLLAGATAAAAMQVCGLKLIQVRKIHWPKITKEVFETFRSRREFHDYCVKHARFS